MTQKSALSDTEVRRARTDAQAKKEILHRIRSAQKLAKIAPGGYAVTRNYITTHDESVDELRELFIDRLIDYKAIVERSTLENLGSTLVKIMNDRHAATACYAEGLNPALFDGFTGTAFPDDLSSDPRTLDSVDLVVTESHTSCAQTGTICLESNPTNGRRALTLVPDCHICIVHMDTVVYGVPEMVARLNRRRPITMISGPSATSDIELARVEGVHGPRTLIVVVVD